MYRDRIPALLCSSFTGRAKVDGWAQACELGCRKRVPEDEHVTEFFLGTGLSYRAEQYGRLARHEKKIPAGDANIAEETPPTAHDDAIRASAIPGKPQDTGTNKKCRKKDEKPRYESRSAFQFHVFPTTCDRGRAGGSPASHRRLAMR
jgi:hypothetical protein